MSSWDIVIVGGGLGAVRTAQALRDNGFAGSLAIFSDEAEAPYDRPPLSKGVLLGTTADTAIQLLKPGALEALQIDLQLSSRAASLMPQSHTLHLENGEAVQYGRLVIATGARPRRLPVFEAHPNVHVLRDVGDARKLRAALAAGQRLAIIGGGLIGLEVASAALSLGAEVTVLEAAEAPLAPVLGPELGNVIRNWHERKGIVFRCGVTVTGIRNDAGIASLLLGDGSVIPADLVLVSVGTIQNTGWLENSGLNIRGGLIVDDLGRTSDPDIYGIGDVTSRLIDGELRPSRQWTATTEHARRVAKAMLGDVNQPAVVDDNYFWSDQHGLRLQYAGRPVKQPKLHYVAGGPGEEKLLVLASAENYVTSVFSLGLPRDFLRYSVELRRGEPVLAPA